MAEGVYHTIRTNHIKARIDMTQQNSKYRLCGNTDEAINHIIRKWGKLAQKECKTRYYWVGKVIHWELCKKFKFKHTNKWYMYNLGSILKNETHKLLGDFEIQTDHKISARQPDLVIVNKKENRPNSKRWHVDWPQSKISRRWYEG